MRSEEQLRKSVRWHTWTLWVLIAPLVLLALVTGIYAALLVMADGSSWAGIGFLFVTALFAFGFFVGVSMHLSDRERSRRQLSRL